jgi:hypothetical protein
VKRPRLSWILLALGTLLLAAWQLARQPRALVADGIRAYAQGDFDGAVELFTSAQEAWPSSTVQRDLALALFGADDLEGAALAADRLVELGKDEDIAWRDFLLGNIAWRRSGKAEAEAHGPIPPAGSLERAIAQAEAAAEAWQAALDARSSWPAAERNLKLVERRLISLLAEQAAAAAEDPDVEHKTIPPDAPTAPMDAAEQERLMRQLERLDLQEAERKAESRPELPGVLEW